MNFFAFTYCVSSPKKQYVLPPTSKGISLVDNSAKPAVSLQRQSFVPPTPPSFYKSTTTTTTTTSKIPPPTLPTRITTQTTSTVIPATTPTENASEIPPTTKTTTTVIPATTPTEIPPVAPIPQNPPHVC